ncbi:alpha/beta fold hydrolase [Aliiglaciecola sp. NS0011-25]|uniref:alpha/beta hydrolase family protein n=1 Tax=Aliiglaciecola sp. NS0011-25 TaxID=3127654 RepID=UPI003340B99F
MNTANSQPVTIICNDKQTINANVFAPAGPIKSAVMIAPATGIKQQFYRNFASYLQAQGYGVITYDNRGIGASLNGNIKKNKATLQCWGEQDMPAVLEHLQATFSNTRYHLVGHSAGGQLIGLMHNAEQLSSMFNFACSSGKLTNMPLAYQFKAHFFMNFFIPASNLLFGHAKSQWVGMGQPLPKGVAKQWRAWCNGQGYVKTAFGKTVFQHQYNDLTLPSFWLNAADDDIANDINVADMISVFPKLPAQTLNVQPKEYGLKEIGHMKFFSKRSEILWPIALEWLDKHSN